MLPAMYLKDAGLRDEALRKIGKLTRTGVAIGGFVLILAVAKTVIPSVADIPLAQLTLGVLGGFVSGVIFTGVATWIWIGWTFNGSDHRPYRAWGWFGLIAMIVGIGVSAKFLD